MEKEYRITDDYLFLPVQTGGDNRRLEIYAMEEGCERKLFEFQIPVRAEEGECFRIDYLGALPMKKRIGGCLLLKGDFPERFFAAVCCGGKPGAFGSGRGENTADSPQRPSLHFTPEAGWINDPNGLVYQNGVYHLYFQYNPFDIRWENMSWGHAVSRDLLHWSWQDAVLFPDEHGTMFSGSGIVNKKGLLGLPEEALLFFYTAAGNNNLWSQGKDFTQRLAYSLDGGKTLWKTDMGAVDSISWENRDPKVFWHEESQAYIMVLWLEKNDFGILRSQDLRKWMLCDRLTLEGGWECPDLVRVREDKTSDPSQANVQREETTAWVFLTADGFYYWGDFDGYRFQTDGVRHCAYMNKVPYAAQTYSNLEDRTVFVPWLRLANRGELYTGAMGLPRELTWIVIGNEKKLRLLPIREYGEERREIPMEGKPLHYDRQQEEQGAVELQLWLEEQAEPVELSINGTAIRIDNKKGILQVAEEACTLPAGVRDYFFLIDDVILEVTANYGTMVGVYELNRHDVDICLEAVSGEVSLYEIC